MTLCTYKTYLVPQGAEVRRIKMKYKNTILGSLLTLALTVGAITVFPAVSTAVGYSEEMASLMQGNVYVKTHNLEYTNEAGQKMQLSVSSNGDDSKILVYANHEGEWNHVILTRDGEGTYMVEDSTFSETDTKGISEIATSNDEWREM